MKPLKFYAIQTKQDGKWGYCPYPGFRSFNEARLRAKAILKYEHNNNPEVDIRIVTFTQTTTLVVK